MVKLIGQSFVAMAFRLINYLFMRRMNLFLVLHSNLMFRKCVCLCFVYLFSGYLLWEIVFKIGNVSFKYIMIELVTLFVCCKHVLLNSF